MRWKKLLFIVLEKGRRIFSGSSSRGARDMKSEFDARHFGRHQDAG